MTIDQMRKANDRRPFRPFEIRMADGRAVTVQHPDTIAWDEESRTAACLSEGGWDVIDVDLITSLGMASPKRRKGTNGA